MSLPNLNHILNNTHILKGIDNTFRKSMAENNDTDSSFMRGNMSQKDGPQSIPNTKSL